MEPVVTRRTAAWMTATTLARARFGCHRLTQRARCWNHSSVGAAPPRQLVISWSKQLNKAVLYRVYTSSEVRKGYNGRAIVMARSVHFPSIFFGFGLYIA